VTAAKRVAIIQSNYMPWKGYFEIAARVDEFILYDEVQFTKRDWRNRNRIKTAAGEAWLTVPVRSKSRFEQPIEAVEIAEPGWAEQHWQTIRHAYRRAPCFAEASRLLEPLYAAAAGETRLSVVNRLFLTGIAEALGIATPFVPSNRYASAGRKSERLIDLCLAAGAGIYLSGPAARSYLDEAAFAAAGIAVEWMDYGPYPEYPQLHGPFDHYVSIVDPLVHCGYASATWFCSGAS